MTVPNPEEKLWRTDIKKGRAVYVLLSNDITKPSEDDPMIGTMETSTMAENVVNTHNGVMALYGRRYPQVLASAEINPPDNPKVETYLKFDRADLDQFEYAHFLDIMEWLYKGPMGSTPVVEKVFRALGGEDE